MDDAKIYHLIADASIVKRWLEIGNASFSEQARFAIEEFKKSADSLRNLKRPYHSVFSPADIQSIISLLDSTVDGLENLKIA